MTHSIKITKTAWMKIGNILKKTNKYSFLFSASGGGCNGYNYTFHAIEQKEFNSILNETKIKPTVIVKNNHRVLIDPLSELLLIGTTIDFEKTIYESKFKFFPNKEIARTCGCGTSFSLRNAKNPDNFVW